MMPGNAEPPLPPSLLPTAEHPRGGFGGDAGGAAVAAPASAARDARLRRRAKREGECVSAGHWSLVTCHLSLVKERMNNGVGPPLFPTAAVPCGTSATGDPGAGIVRPICAAGG